MLLSSCVLFCAMTEIRILTGVKARSPPLPLSIALFPTEPPIFFSRVFRPPFDGRWVRLARENRNHLHHKQFVRPKIHLFCLFFFVQNSRTIRQSFNQKMFLQTERLNVRDMLNYVRFRCVVHSFFFFAAFDHFFLFVHGRLELHVTNRLDKAFSCCFFYFAEKNV